MGGFSTGVFTQLYQQVHYGQEPAILQRSVREVFAEVYGLNMVDVDSKLQEWGIDLSGFGMRLVWEADRTHPGKETGAVIAVPGCEPDAFIFKVPAGTHTEFIMALYRKVLSKIEAKDIVKFDGKGILCREADSYLLQSLAKTAKILEVLVGKRAANKWLKEQTELLEEMISTRPKKLGVSKV
ncbi:MAG TPA: hypothetical protein VJJ80_02525 [Patescibacteria group bacterium]|nr:hypothetical protein [Patescibacteria group bacterium]